MPCQNITPTSKENFTDHEEIIRAVNVFDPRGSPLKGTIAFLLGGYLDKESQPVTVGSKGWANTARHMTSDECQVIEELCNLGWRILIFDSMQFARPTGKPYDEMWIGDYAKWIVQKFSRENKKLFMAGFSSGAYIIGLHLKHLSSRKTNVTMSGYGLFSFSVKVDDPANKTDFTPDDFKIPTLFIIGSSTRDTLDKPPFVDGYENISRIYEYSASKSAIKHHRVILDSDHFIFSVQDDNGKKTVTNAIHDWFSSL
jgi:alpha/beta superfamily hydrolase